LFDRMSVMVQTPAIPSPPENHGEVLAVKPTLPAKTCRVLLAETNRSRRSAVATVLTENGYEAVECDDSEAILRRAKQEAPDVVLLDVTLPGGQPEQCIRALKRCYQTAGASIILSCPHSFSRQHLAEMIHDGATGVLAKPYTRAQLLEAVTAAVERAQSHRTELEMEHGVRAAPTRRVESNNSLMVRTIHCLLHEDRPVLNRYLLRPSSVNVESDCFGVPTYKPANAECDAIDFNRLCVMVCPRCLFASTHSGYFLDTSEPKEHRHRFDAVTRKALADRMAARKLIAREASPQFFTENRTPADALVTYALAAQCSVVLYEQNPFVVPQELARMADYQLGAAHLQQPAQPQAAMESRKAAVEPLKKAVITLEGQDRYKAAMQLVGLGIALGDMALGQKYMSMLADVDAAASGPAKAEIQPYLQKARQEWDKLPVL
jgi:DNA-binding response OmpR family regulator